MTFRETRLIEKPGYLALLDKSNKVVLELRGQEIDDAVRAGYLDPEDSHFSMFEYFRIGREADRAYMRELGIKWD
jgi:hypothetical protein